MAWQTIDYTGLYNGGTLMGYTYFEYDDSSSEPRSVRLRIQSIPQTTFYINFSNVIVDGTNVGSWSNITQDSGVFWTGSLSGGRTVEAHWTNPWYAGYQYPSVEGNLPSAVVAPSAPSTTWISHTWNSVTGTVSISSYGTPSSDSNRYVELGVCDASKTSYGAPYRYNTKKAVTSATLTVTATSSGALSLKGMTHYKLGGWVTNTQASNSSLQSTIRYTPPAPGQLSYAVDPSDESQQTISYTGVASNNQTTYDTSELKRTVRYADLSDPTNWTYIDNDAVKAIGATTSQLLTIAPQHSVRVEAWMTYHGGSSEVSTVTLTNSQLPRHLYGAVYDSTAGELVTNEIEKLYASVNGNSKKITKFYGSVNGVAKLIFEDNT